MKIIRDEEKLEEVIKKYQLEHYFTDMSQYRKGMKLVEFPKNTLLYSRKEHRKYAFFLVDGVLQVSAAIVDGRQMLVRYCDEFIFIGDMELLGYQESESMAETLTECLFVAVDILLMKNELMEDKKFLRFLCNNLAEKLSYFANKQFQYQCYSPHERVASYLLNHMNDDMYFKENLREVSKRLDISYRHLHRILSEFVEKDILKRTESGYQIINEEELKK